LMMSYLTLLEKKWHHGYGAVWKSYKWRSLYESNLLEKASI
jgi:hypothetical protein